MMNPITPYQKGGNFLVTAPNRVHLNPRRQKRSSFLSHRILRSLPKIELHRHLDCSLRWSTLVEIATQLKLIPEHSSPKQIENELLIRHPLKDLNEVLLKFQKIRKFFGSKELISRFAYEACEDAFNDGIRILELRYSPFFMSQPQDSSLNYLDIHEAIMKGILKARQNLPMAIGLIAILDRTQSPEILDPIFEFIVDIRSDLVGIDLADREEGFEPAKFAKYFNRFRDLGLGITIHAGESPYQKSPQAVIEAIEILGAQRIGHGVQIINSEAAIQTVLANNATLEICPLSNYLTQAFSSHFVHPVRKLFEKGIKITINSDDPGLFGSTLTDEYEILQRVHKFSVLELMQLNQISFEASFIEDKIKTKVWRESLSTYSVSGSSR